MTNLYTILSGLLSFGQNIQQAFINYDAELAPLLNFPVVEPGISYSAETSVYTLSGETEYSLEDLKIYKTEISDDTTFILPQISNEDIHHEIVMSVKFNEQVEATYQDYQGNELTMMNEDTWDSGDVVQYLIRYESFLNKWCIMSVKMS